MANTPNIRFKGFSDEWEERKLGDEATEILAGGDINRDKVCENGKYPIYANALTNDGIIGYYNDYFRVKAPAVTVTGRGDVGYAKARDINFTPVVRLLSVRSKHDSYFLEHAINNHKVLVESTGVPQLTVPQLESYNIYFPDDLEEEKKIGKYLKNLDNLITLHQRKCDETKELKKYMLQKMFPKKGEKIPEIRFAGFTDDWEQCKLGKEAEFNPKSELPEVFEYVDLESVVGTEMVSHRQEIRSEAPSRAQRLASQGDLFYQTVRPYQRNNYLFELPFDNYVFSTGYAQMRPKIDGYFLLSIVQTDGFVNSVLDRCTGTSYPAINSSDLADMDIIVAQDNNEQRKIGDYFRNLDSLITHHQRKCDQLKELKKFMLQNMFPQKG